MRKPAVAYIRVSTKAQGKSGLGLDAQQEALARFAKAEGFHVIALVTADAVILVDVDDIAAHAAGDLTETDLDRGNRCRRGHRELVRGSKQSKRCPVAGITHGRLPLWPRLGIGLMPPLVRAARVPG